MKTDRHPSADGMAEVERLRAAQSNLAAYIALRTINTTAACMNFANMLNRAEVDVAFDAFREIDGTGFIANGGDMWGHLGRAISDYRRQHPQTLRAEELRAVLNESGPGFRQGRDSRG